MNRSRIKNYFTRNNKILYIILGIVLVSVCSLTIVYAALSVSLNIVGNADIVASNWDIHLENPKVSNGSVTNTLPIISGNTMTFSSSLVDPGDYYEFTVDVVNDGTIDAMIDSVVITPELTTEQKKYLRHEVTYQNGEDISSKQILKKNSSMPIKFRVEFRNDIDVADLPSTETNLSHTITLVYTQSDGTGSSVKDDGFSYAAFATGSLDDFGTQVRLGTEQFNIIGSDGDNILLLSKYNLYVGGYYNVEDNVWSAYGDEATGIQHSSMIGYYENGNIYRGVTNYSDGNIAYEGSKVEGYVNNYKDILESTYGIDIVEARLIYYSELIDTDTFNCNTTTYNCEFGSNSWISNTSYWSDPGDDSTVLWEVLSSGVFYNYDCYNTWYFGVRPVISIPRSLIGNRISIEFTVDGTTYQAEEGMTWLEWVDSSYDEDNFFWNTRRLYR